MTIGQTMFLWSIIDTINKKNKKIFNRWIENIDEK